MNSYKYGWIPINMEVFLELSKNFDIYNGIDINYSK